MFRSASNLGLMESLVGVRGILGPGTAYPSAYLYPGMYGYRYPYYGYGYWVNPYWSDGSYNLSPYPLMY